MRKALKCKFMMDVNKNIKKDLYMTFSKLPRVCEDKKLKISHFPDEFHAAVFRLWETADVHSIARATFADVSQVQKAAENMGLPPQKNIAKWEKSGYITTIRNSWHILPYDQLLTLLGWSEDKLATVLKEEDFLGEKLGNFKPYCEKVVPGELNQHQKNLCDNIKSVMKRYFSDIFDGAEPFDFFRDCNKDSSCFESDGIRMIFSYCGLYSGVLDDDIELSYPDKLLMMYKDAGINALWLPVVLYQMVAFPFGEGYSDGWQMRRERLKEIIKKAGKYGIKIYLYLNEPRCMPLQFFEKYPKFKGHTLGKYGAMCTSKKEVMDYMSYAIRELCTAVPDIGGFFLINCSENLTHCKSKGSTICECCKDIPMSKLISDIVALVSKESRKVNSNIKTIAWTWGWDSMTKDEIKECIDRLPEEVIIQCSSENNKEYLIGGVRGNVVDYSMSIPGPSPLSKFVWDYARKKGHEVCAKVQINVTWECSTLPFLPVYDLIREHMKGLRECGAKHLMLSWTLGGYPSFNLKVASKCLEDPDEEKYDTLLKEEFGEFAPDVKKATTIFSEAFRDFPFHVQSLYRGPQNAGPSNLLYIEPTGFESTMTCYSYDDLENWRADYPADVYVSQFYKLSTKWKKGLDLLENMPDCEFKQAAWGGYVLFRSSYLQSKFILSRGKGDKSCLSKLIYEEKEMALVMYELMQKSSLFGFEAANHYYFNKMMLAEKVINCEHLMR